MYTEMCNSRTKASKVFEIESDKNSGEVLKMIVICIFHNAFVCLLNHWDVLAPVKLQQVLQLWQCQLLKEKFAPVAAFLHSV